MFGLTCYSSGSSLGGHKVNLRGHKMIKEIKKKNVTLSKILYYRYDVSQTLKALPKEVGPLLVSEPTVEVSIHLHGSENEPVEKLLKCDMQKYI